MSKQLTHNATSDRFVCFSFLIAGNVSMTQSLKVAILIVVLCALPCTQGVCCGADLGDAFGTDHYWYLQLPSDTVLECHRQFLTFDDYALPDIHGYAWELNACVFAGNPGIGGICAGGFNGVVGSDWCDDNPVGNDDDDDDGQGTNNIIDFDTPDALAPGTCGNEQRITRTWRSTTPCPGQGTITDIQQIFIEDTTEPWLCIPNDVTIECTPDSAANPYAQDFVFGFASAFDMCTDVTLTRTIGTFAPNGVCQFTATVTYVASDPAGLAACFSPQQTHSASIVDTRPPVVASSSDVQSLCSNVPSVADTQPTAVDACGIFPNAPTVTFVTETTIPGDCAGRYVLEREYSLEDQCGNSDSTYVYVIVEDFTPPVFTPDFPSGNLPGGGFYRCEEDIIFETFTAADDCSGDELKFEETFYYSESHEERIGTIITQVISATDGCGNHVERYYDYVIIRETRADLVVNGPVTAAKGATFTVNFIVYQAFIQNCNHLTLVIDAGSAVLQAGSFACFQQAASGLIYCENPADGVNLNLELQVPDDYLPNNLLVVGTLTANQATVFGSNINSVQILLT